MSDYSKLKELAEAATKGVWRYGPGDGESECPIVFVDLPQASSVAISILFEGDWATDVDAKFVSEANPAVVLELIADNERLQGCEDVLRQLSSHVGAGGYNAPEVDPETFARKIMDGINILNDPLAQLVIKKGEQIDQLRAEVAGLKTGYEAYEQVNAELKAEVEGLRKLGPSKEIIWCACGDGYPVNSHGAGFMDANNGVCANCDAALGQGVKP